MTVDEAFDRMENVEANELMVGDVAIIGHGQAPKEIRSINRQGDQIQFKFVDKTERFAHHAETVCLCMD